ncbi:EPM2AIP1 (predicted) [Pycnogonum litorale]
MNTTKKRKVEDECRTFNKEWTYKYFFTDVGSEAVCLICHASIAVFKEYNLKRHFQTKRSNFGKNLSESELQRKANEMLRNLQQEETTFVKQSKVQETATNASFVVAHRIAQRNKAFSDAEFLKDCMLDAVDIVCPEVKTKIEAIPLSRRTVVRRIEAISENISVQLLDAGKTFEW